jgi:hypothetical protein
MRTTILVVDSVFDRELFQVHGEGIPIPRVGEDINIGLKGMRASYELRAVRDVNYFYEPTAVTVAVRV